MSALDRTRYWHDRARRAESALAWAKDDAEHTLAWASREIAETRRLHDRCTYLYGLAARHGASDDELRDAFGVQSDPIVAASSPTNV